LKEINRYTGEVLREKAEKIRNLILRGNKIYQETHDSLYPKARFEYLDPETKILMPYIS
jgi:hypothetical protein